jgi:hypothetical protein
MTKLKAKSKLNQTENNIAVLEKQNNNIKKDIHNPSRKSKLIHDDNMDDAMIEEKKDDSRRHSRQSLSSSSKVPLHDEADVQWMSRMLQAQSEIEDRLGHRYY